MATTRAALAHLIAAAIKTNGQTVQSIVTATHIPRTTLDRSLYGERPFTTSELVAIGAALGTTGATLLAAAEHQSETTAA